MKDPNCDTCYSFLYKDMDGFEGKCNYCKKGWTKRKR